MTYLSVRTDDICKNCNHPIYINARGKLRHIRNEYSKQCLVWKCYCRRPEVI